MRTSDPTQFLPLRPVEFEILLTLAAGERHGYAIIQETDGRTDGAMKLETGTMYRGLRRLVSIGLVKPGARRPVSAEPYDERRRYYSITALGRAVAAAEAERMAKLVAVARGAQLLPGTR